MRTVVPRMKRGGVTAAGSGVSRKWHVIDANGQVLGRVATLAARLLQDLNNHVNSTNMETGVH